MNSIQRLVGLLGILLSLSTCGSSSGGGGGGGATPAAVENTSYTMVVDSDGDLPACGAANNKQLVYVKSTSTFKTCDANAWADISIAGKDGAAGAAGAAGLSIVSNQLLNPYTTNICTMYPSIESCYFNGGQLVKYSDGSVLITGAYSYDLYVSAASNGGHAEFDRFGNSITLLIPPSTTAAFQRLDWAVSNGTTAFRHLYLVYQRSTDAVTIVFDSNGTNAPEAADTVIHTVVKANW